MRTRQAETVISPWRSDRFDIALTSVRRYDAYVTSTTPPHVTDLLRRLRDRAGSPCLTWYGPDGERIELSCAVVENWVSKTTNLLVEEFDADSSCAVAIDVIPHWRSLVWALATWRTGATLVDGNSGDAVVTTAPSDVAAGDVVAVALPALARRYDGDLPPSAMDAASAVMTYGDQIGWTSETDDTAAALRMPEAPSGVRATDVGYGELLATADAAAADVAPGARVLLEAPAGGLGPWLLRAVGVLARDGSLVLAAADVAAELRSDPARRERLVSGERVDADLLS